jgi:hypothetical protein
MGLYGNLNTMTLEEILRWVEAGRKTGTLEFERENICKRMMFREGRVVACSSNDPATLMGQFLLSRGKIDPEVLEEAMSRQERVADNLGQILSEMGTITDEDRRQFVEAKIEETIFGLFDWEDAAFRFYADAPPDPNAVEVSLEIKDIRKGGGRRQKESQRTRKVISDTGIVLHRTGRTDPPELSVNQTARRVFGLIDGRRTVAEILLCSHAPEFLVNKFLTVLLHRGAVEIKEIRPETQQTPAAVADSEVEALPTDRPSPDIAEPPPTNRDLPATPEPEPEPAPAPEPKAKQASRVLTRQPEQDRKLQSEINVALQMMAGGQPETALELLNAMVEQHPADEALRQLVANAERDFWEKTLSGGLPPASVPSSVATSDANAEDQLSAEESFLIGHIDGRRDVRTLMWLAPMREVETLRTLTRMLRKGLIQVTEPAKLTT